jgi:hypothetical protein
VLMTPVYVLPVSKQGLRQAFVDFIDITKPSVEAETGGS